MLRSSVTVERFWDIICEAVWKEDLGGLASKTDMPVRCGNGGSRVRMLGSQVAELTMVGEDPSSGFVAEGIGGSS